MVTALWTWRGQYFGYRRGDFLWTKAGAYVGRFWGNDLYAPCGRYLGESISQRLYVRPLKRLWRKKLPSPYRLGVDIETVTQGWS